MRYLRQFICAITLALVPSLALATGLLSNPSGSFTLTSATTAYTAGQLIASSATANLIVVPQIQLPDVEAGTLISRVRLSTNDATSTAWGAQTVQVDLWSSAPTFTNGDRGTWSPATGTASHLGAFTCTMSTEYGDGAYAECAPAVGNFMIGKITGQAAIFWTLQAVTGSGLTGISKKFTLTLEFMN